MKKWKDIFKCPTCDQPMTEFENNSYGCPNCKTTVIQYDSNYAIEDTNTLNESLKDKAEQIIKTFNAGGTKH